MTSKQEVRLISRNRIDFSDNYPQVVDSLKLLPAKDAIIDGEVAALDPQGRSPSSSCNPTGSESKSR